MEKTDKESSENRVCCGGNCSCKTEESVTTPAHNVQACDSRVSSIPMVHKACGGDACKCNSQK